MYRLANVCDRHEYRCDSAIASHFYVYASKYKYVGDTLNGSFPQCFHFLSMSMYGPMHTRIYSHIQLRYI